MAAAQRRTLPPGDVGFGLHLGQVHIFVAIPPTVAPDCPLPLNISTVPLSNAASSLMIEWGLLCGREQEADALESAFMAGMLFGAGIIGNLADRWGRRVALIMCAFGAFVGAVWSALASAYFSYLCSRAVSGFFVAGLGLVCFVHTSEVLGQDRRVVLVVSGTVLFALGVAVLSKVAFILRENWRLVHWAVACASGALLGMLPFVEESPRWLSAAGRRKQALEVMRHIADYNDRVLYSDPERPVSGSRVDDGSGEERERGERGPKQPAPTSSLTGHSGEGGVQGGGFCTEGATAGESEDAGKDGAGDWQLCNPLEENVVQRQRDEDGSAGARSTVDSRHVEAGGSMGAPDPLDSYVDGLTGAEEALVVAGHRFGNNVASSCMTTAGPLQAEVDVGRGGIAACGVGENEAEVAPVNAYAELWVLKVRLLASMMLWFSCSFGYYGLSLSVGALGGSVYDSSFANSLLELPSNLAAAVMVEQKGWGRRNRCVCVCVRACARARACIRASHAGGAATAREWRVSWALSSASLPRSVRPAPRCS
jgi:hypothetical protein